jgi:hypothetical protein
MEITILLAHDCTVSRKEQAMPPNVEAVEAERFESRLLLEDTSELVLRMDGPTLCSLADMVSQYATP